MKTVKSIESFQGFSGASQGTIESLRICGETSPRTMEDWRRTVELLNKKPVGQRWAAWKVFNGFVIKNPEPVLDMSKEAVYKRKKEKKDEQDE